MLTATPTSRLQTWTASWPKASASSGPIVSALRVGPSASPAEPCSTPARASSASPWTWKGTRLWGSCSAATTLRRSARASGITASRLGSRASSRVATSCSAACRTTQGCRWWTSVPTASCIANVKAPVFPARCSLTRQSTSCATTNRTSHSLLTSRSRHPTIRATHRPSIGACITATLRRCRPTSRRIIPSTTDT